MADQVTFALDTQLEQLSAAEIASLVIELVNDERVAVPLGEELFRRLNHAAPSVQASPAEWLWYQPPQTAFVGRRDTHA